LLAWPVLLERRLRLPWLFSPCDAWLSCAQPWRPVLAFQLWLLARWLRPVLLALPVRLAFVQKRR
jgi:hypothetical protein